MATGRSPAKSVRLKGRLPELDLEDAEFRRALEASKRESTLQVLFKVSRLLDEIALGRIAAQFPGALGLGRSHTSLFPHITLEGTRISDLAEQLGVSKQAVSQLVDDLERLGVVTRAADPADRRAVRVRFTERGRRGLLEGLAVLRQLEGELGAQIGKTALQQLRAALLAIHDRLATSIR